MSATPASPEAPSKQNMAISSENSQPPRTPLTNKSGSDDKRPEEQLSEIVTQPSSPGKQIQVPAPQGPTISDASEVTVVRPQATPRRHSPQKQKKQGRKRADEILTTKQVDGQSSTDSNHNSLKGDSSNSGESGKRVPSRMQTQNINEEGSTEEQSPVEDDLELPEFDWSAFEAEYTKAIRAADEGENELSGEFDKLCSLFSLWADAASEHDNTRAVKRLKTRERFVQISEGKFEDKKKHYVEVVDAFKKALALLHG